MAANDTKIKQVAEEDIVIDENNLELVNFFTSTEIVHNSVITADEIFEIIDLELSEVRVIGLKLIKEDVINMVEVLDSNQTIADKVSMIYFCPIDVEKYKQQINFEKHVPQFEIQDKVRNTAYKLYDDTSKLLNFLVSLQL